MRCHFPRRALPDTESVAIFLLTVPVMAGADARFGLAAP